jgi:sugar lactone lactonase YvrE
LIWIKRLWLLCVPIILCLVFVCWKIENEGARVNATFAQKKIAQAIGPTATTLDWAAYVAPFAGGGARGLVDGSLNLARFSDPFGIAVDGDGNVYVSDGGDSNRIRKITPAGIVSTLAGSTEGFVDGTTDAAFNTPSGIAVDAAGNVFVADTGNNAIRKITPQGVVSTLAGDGKAGYRDGAANQAQFNGPIGIAVDHGGNIYVADTYNDRIRMISVAGQVTTLAGSNTPGYQDGMGGNALFDTPCALAIDGNNKLYVADTRNDAIRIVTLEGQVTTLVQAEHDAKWRRPLGLAATTDGYLYVGEMGHGRIMQIAPDGEVRGLTGVGIDFPIGDDTALRFATPAGIALTKDGALLVSDSIKSVVRKVMPKTSIDTAPVTAKNELIAVPASSPAPTPTTTPTSFPWPLKPQYEAHEVVGTVGEVRGRNDGDSRDHFHAGLDVHANLGTPVLAIAAGKVSDPLAAWGYDELNEGVSINGISYVHIRVGRDESAQALDPARFILAKTADGKPRVRVRRGTRFLAGDTLGTINRMYHVHLGYSEEGVTKNPLKLKFAGYVDRMKPTIEGIQLVDADGNALKEKKAGRLLVSRDATSLSLIVSAYDQADGDAARRRLGLFSVGYQILQADGKPVAGYEKPVVNIEFSQLPPDDESVKIAYADGSGETVHGSKVTRFLYIVTNKVRDGQAQPGSLDVAGLTEGAYIIRVFANDYAGNVATANRDLPIYIK